MVINAMKTKTKVSILTIILAIILVPVHEFGHYIIAKSDGATIVDINLTGEYGKDGLTNPHVLVDEFTFSSIPALVSCYLAGFFLTFSIGSIALIVLVYRGSPYWLCAYSWVVVSPLASLNDIERVIQLIGPTSLAKDFYVILGALSVYHLYQIRAYRAIER